MTNPRRDLLTVLSFLVGLLVIGLGGREVWRVAPHADQNAAFDESNVLVISVVDGDTIKVADEQSRVIKTVRLIGIDTPETKDPRKPVQYFGTEASKFTSSLLLHRHVVLKKDVSETDRYGRILRYVYLGDGTFVNDKLVRDGYAKAATFPPDVRYADLFSEAERDAREHKRGLWQ